MQVAMQKMDAGTEISANAFQTRHAQVADRTQEHRIREGLNIEVKSGVAARNDVSSND